MTQTAETPGWESPAVPTRDSSTTDQARLSGESHDDSTREPDSDEAVRDRADAELFLTSLFPPHQATGKLSIPTSKPGWQNGRCTSLEWNEGRPFSFPDQLDAALSRIMKYRKTHDVYAGTGLAHKNRAHEGSLREVWSLHVDFDGDPTACTDVLQAIKELGGFAVYSGTHGHIHGYVALSEPITVSAHFSELCRAFHRQLPPGVDIAKFKWNDVLRIPGTYNHKSVVRPGDTGQPTRVTWAVRP